jgi:cobalt transporter subunit CbtA
MIQRMLASAMFAGVVAGLLAALLHFTFVQSYILLGEDYESGALTHFAGASDAGHDHAAMATNDGTGTATEVHDHGAEASGHEHDHGASGERSGLARDGLTVLFMALVYVGYGLMLVAGFALADRFGRRVTARDGLLWGIAGFAAFQLMPAMGLSPELPGTMAADLSARQAWWLGTAVCTAAALALIGYGRGWMAYVLAIVLLALPHLIGAPQVEGFSGVAPPEVAAAFAARALGVGLVAWAVLGWLTARLWDGKAA